MPRESSPAPGDRPQVGKAGGPAHSGNANPPEKRRGPA
jgi:hypothetical protein